MMFLKSQSHPLFTLLFFIFTKETSSIKSLIIRVPEIVKSGDTVTLTCDYDLENSALYSIRWYKDGEEFYRYVPREKPPSKAFPVQFINVDIPTSSKNDVTLTDIRRELSGQYKCEVSEDAPTFHTAILQAYMNVIELPKRDVEITVYPTRAEIGQKIEADCFCYGTDPAANLTWYINEEKITDETSSVITYPTKRKTDPATSLISTRSKLVIIANQTHFQNGVMSVKCQATILTIWRQSAVDFVKDITPPPVVVYSQSQLGSFFSSIMSSAADRKWKALLSAQSVFLWLPPLFAIVYGLSE